MPCFSVVVIARNEEKSLPRLLAGLRGFQQQGGEVLIVDTGSTDGTVALARAHGCRVEEVGLRFTATLTPAQARAINERFAAEGEGPLVAAGDRPLFHFGDARQEAGRLARHEHVLQLDASDELLAFDVDVLDDQIRAGRASRYEYVLHLGTTSLRVSRFYDRRLDHWQGRVHEVLQPMRDPPAARPPTVRCSESRFAVRHHKDDAKPRNYLAGLALDAIEHPENPRWEHYLGRELSYHRFHRSAVRVLLEHAGRDQAWRAERSESLCLAGQCFEAIDEPDRAEDAYRRAVAIDSTRREPLLRLAALAARRADFDASVGHAAAALAIPRTNGFAESDLNYSHLPHAFLYWGLFWLGRQAEARAHWEQSCRLAPDDPMIREHTRLFPGERDLLGSRRSGHAPVAPVAPVGPVEPVEPVAD